MRGRVAIPLVLVALAVAEAGASSPASLMPPVPRGSLHPEPGLYFVCGQTPDSTCVLVRDEGEKAAPLPESAVVLVHGLDDSGEVWQDLAPALHEAGRALLFFEYPNDQGIALSADALGAALRDARARGVQRVDLVCHSMGGLVARDVLTRDAHYAGRGAPGDDLPQVERLILIATPNAGAPIAYVRAPNDLIEHALAWRQVDAPFMEIFDLSCDGDGQAGIDLRPGSAFLADLNARPAPVGMCTTVIVAQALGDADATPEASADSEPQRGLGRRVRMWWKRLVQRVVQALGDGAVPTDSAALGAADETLRVQCSHVGLLRADPVGAWIIGAAGCEAQASPALALVLERVGTPTPTATPEPTPATPTTATSPSLPTPPVAVGEPAGR